MKRKFVTIVVLLLAICLFAGCEREFTPDPAVREYLNNGMTAEKAYDQIAKVSYTETRSLVNTNGEVGTFYSEVHLDKSDPDNLSLTIHAVYTGECVDEDEVTETTSVLAKREDGTYAYTVTKRFTDGKSMVNEDVMETSDARNLATAIVYSDNGVYDEGLYYGDLFMLRIFRFPSESFYVDVDNDLCVFDEGMLIKDYMDLQDVKLYQVTKINHLGLLVYNSEMYVATQSDYVMTSVLIPTYEYVTK